MDKKDKFLGYYKEKGVIFSTDDRRMGKTHWTNKLKEWLRQREKDRWLKIFKKQKVRTMGNKFDLKKVYTKIMFKKQLLNIIERTKEKKFQVIFLPTSKNSADILIRDIQETKGENNG